MGTRSDIIVHLADGTWKRIYCQPIERPIEKPVDALVDAARTGDLAAAISTGETP